MSDSTPVPKVSKVCRRCGETKEFDLFKKDYRNGDGNSSFCKACHQAASVKWQKENPEKVNATRRRRYDRNKESINAKRKLSYNPKAVWAANLKRLYGVDVQWFSNQLEVQGGGCAICGARPESHKNRFAVDHDHKCCPGRPTCTKCNRGILCHTCNMAISQIEAVPNWAAKAQAYIQKYT